MELMEDGNILDRIPILLSRDLEYYQKNHTVLSETVCKGVVGGRLDFPRNASFASVKIVLWLEEEFRIAFGTGSGLFIEEETEKGDCGVVKTSDPDKFVVLAIKSADALLEHLHALAQEALDHADLPVLTATLGAAALLRNSLHCYMRASEESGSAQRNSNLQSCYKRFATMSEAVGERMLDLHVRLLSLYLLQDAGGRPIDGHAAEAGSASVQGWWLYMQGTRQDLWETVPPRMAQRIFGGMLNDTLTILTVRYCQSTTSGSTALLVNDIINILVCCARLLPSVSGCGAHLAGANLHAPATPADVRDAHAKCDQLFLCMVYRAAPLHFIHQVFKDTESARASAKRDQPAPWFTLASPELFGEDSGTTSSLKTAVALELQVLLAQPQPNWSLVIKVLMMRNCYLLGLLVRAGVRGMSREHGRWRASGLWLGAGGRCAGVLCTADGFCKAARAADSGEEYARAVGALTYVAAALGSRQQLRDTLVAALEASSTPWAACLDKRQVWCERRPAWLAGALALVGPALRVLPSTLVRAVQGGASMYQTMSLCLTCISRILPSVPEGFRNAAAVLQEALPEDVAPVGGSVLLQMLVTVLYEELQDYARAEALNEKPCPPEANGDAVSNKKKVTKKQVKIQHPVYMTVSSSLSFDASSSPSSVALAVAEALCSIDEDDKHTDQIGQLVAQADQPVVISDKFGLEDFMDFAASLKKEGESEVDVESSADAAVLTTKVLITAPGRDSLRVIHEHLVVHAERLYRELGVSEVGSGEGGTAQPGSSGAGGTGQLVPLSRAPLLYTMFHIGRRPFDQYLRGEWPLNWGALVRVAKAWSGLDGARVHVSRREDMRTSRAAHHNANTKRMLSDLHEIFKGIASDML